LALLPNTETKVHAYTITAVGLLVIRQIEPGLYDKLFRRSASFEDLCAFFGVEAPQPQSDTFEFRHQKLGPEIYVWARVLGWQLPSQFNDGIFGSPFGPASDLREGFLELIRDGFLRKFQLADMDSG